MDVAEHSTTTVPPPTTSTLSAIERERIKIEFYKTYDVMTGVRIAGTLGGFFALMVILVVYKSKSKSDEDKVLSDPQLAAAVVEAEEGRQFNAALDETIPNRCVHPRVTRRSLSNTSAPACMMGRYSLDQGSIYSHHHFCHHHYEQYHDHDHQHHNHDQDYDHNHDHPYHRVLLNVPGTSTLRRESNATTTTCSISESSYLERRDSAVTLGPFHPHRVRKLTSSSILGDSYPIDIQVTQATPRDSPDSDRKLYIPARGMAPLASISSCASSVVVDYPDLDLRSLGSDSVFLDDDECMDTDDEVTPFSTDSDSSSDNTLNPGPIVQMAELHHPPHRFNINMPSTSRDMGESSKSQETLF